MPSNKSLIIFRDLYNSGADVLMIFEDLLNTIHSITQIKISPDIKSDISIPELERVKGSEFANHLSMNSLSIMWQVLFKGFQELQNGFHLFQHGEMIIVRLIFINNSPQPEELNKKNSLKKIDQPKPINKPEPDFNLATMLKDLRNEDITNTSEDNEDNDEKVVEAKNK